MARSKRNSKKIVKGGEWSLDPRKWFTNKPTTESDTTQNPLTTETSVDVKNEPEQSQKGAQVTQGTQGTQAAQGAPAAPVKSWGIFGGKTKKSKSKGKKTRKARNVRK